MFQRIKSITAVDMANKTKLELFLSVIEEYGELAKEIKVEQKVFCNAHKKLDEGSAGESIDLFITAAAMMYAIDPEFGIDGDDLFEASYISFGTLIAMKTISSFLDDMNSI
jgi:hypothetical protein